MINKKWMFVMSSVLIAGLLTACGTGATTNGGTETVKQKNNQKDEEKFQTFIETKEENHAVNVNYKVKNVSGEAQKLTFPTGLKADYIIYDEEGKKVKQYSEEVSSTQAIVEVTLEKNEELENGFTISDLYNGTFKIEVFLTAHEEQAKVSKELIVENSMFSKGVGEYVGQIDPHSIEMKIEGKTTAFQLSETAIQQIPSLKEGVSVTFVYSENELQKIIEKFILE